MKNFNKKFYEIEKFAKVFFFRNSCYSSGVQHNVQHIVRRYPILSNIINLPASNYYFYVKNKISTHRYYYTNICQYKNNV